MTTKAEGSAPASAMLVTELFPVIATSDIGRALGFYRDLLGGATTYEFAGPDGALVYVGLDIGGSSLGLATPGADGAARSMSLWAYVGDCDALVDILRAAGVTVTEEPTDQPWGERVARVLDPDGNEVLIGQRKLR